ncbi:MAG: helix-turn-helix domain-containing protein [Planctomycetaceae bacterium]|nr:helix-turn-helix domain-containing protein [Planctomycetaceae bacterium]
MLSNDLVLDRLPEIDGTSLKVLLALTRRTNQSGRCWPSQATIAADTGLQPRAVRGALTRLKGLLLVGTESKPGHATVYSVTLAPPCRPETGGAAPPCLPPRHDDAGDPGTAVPTTLAPPCLQNKNHRTTPKNKTHRTTPKRGCAASVEIPACLRVDGFPEAWANWLGYRRNRKLTCTTATLEGQLRKLKALGPRAAVDEIENSIANGWQSVCYQGGNYHGNAKHGFPVGQGQRFAGAPARIGEF